MRKTMAIIKSPTQIRDEQARGLISLLSNIKATVDENKIKLKNALVQLNGVLERFYDYKDTQLRTAEQLKSNILILEREKCSSISDSCCNIHDIAEDTKVLIDSIIAEVEALGLPERKVTLDKSVNVNTMVSQNQEQHQNQKQDVIVKILLEAVKDELTGKQWKELLAVAKVTTDPVESRKSILDKIKSFGEGVASNIVANIVTNPVVWQSLGTFI